MRGEIERGAPLSSILQLLITYRGIPFLLCIPTSPRRVCINVCFGIAGREVRFSSMPNDFSHLEHTQRKPRNYNISLYIFLILCVRFNGCWKSLVLVRRWVIGSKTTTRLLPPTQHSNHFNHFNQPQHNILNYIQENYTCS